MAEYLKDLKNTIFTYYDKNGEKQEEFNTHYVKLMNDNLNGSTFNFDTTGSDNDKDGRYADEGLIKTKRTFDAHNKKVLGGNRENYNMDNSYRYYEDDGFNDQFLRIYETASDVVVTFNPTTPASFTVDSDDMVIHVLPAINLVSVKNGQTALTKSQYSYKNGDLTLKNAYIKTLNGENTFTLTYKKDDGTTATIDYVVTFTVVSNE